MLKDSMRAFSRHKLYITHHLKEVLPVTMCIKLRGLSSGVLELM